MNNVINKEKTKWLKPWQLEKFDNIYDRDERFFSLITKGVLGWLTNNIIMYNKPIKHFIMNTGSSYMYIENNGYEFSWTETSGENWIYNELPRCVVNIGQVTIPQEELTQPFVRGTYDRITDEGIQTFNSEIRRLPIEWGMTLRYIFGTFNEAIVVLQELLDKVIFQKYFTITYLGQQIECSIEFPNMFDLNVNQIDMTTTEVNQKTLEIEIVINTSYPIINELTEISAEKQIIDFDARIDPDYIYTDTE